MMRCAQCGSEVSDGSAACPGCGRPVHNDESTNVAPDEPPAAYSPEAVGSAGILNAPLFVSDTSLKGIGGWLIPTVIGLTLGPLFCLRGIYADLHVLYGGSFQARLTSTPGFAVLILFEAITNAVFLIALIGLNFEFYKTRRSFPRLMIAYLVARFCLALFDNIWAMHYHPSASWTGVFQRLIAALIWVPYFINSRRVEQTFVD